MGTTRVNKWKLTYKVLPFIAGILIVKFIAHSLGWEVLSLSSLFSAIISANVFLVGFLISGVLVDYKESEKLPGELACSLESIADECRILYMARKPKEAKALYAAIADLTRTLILWMHKKETTDTVHQRLTDLNIHFLAFEPLTQANFIARLKQEQNALRRVVTRIHTIRETSFNPSGYAIAEVITTILCCGLVFTKFNPYYESLFFVAFVSFILIYMILLIRDLDNPFGFYEKENYADEVSIKPLIDLERRLTGPLS